MSGQPYCNSCAPKKLVKMRLGKALMNTMADGRGVPMSYLSRGDTISATGPVKEVEVFKCPECGHSFRTKAGLE